MAEIKDQEFNERVVAINRVTKVVKGGRRFSFSALVVAGDGQGRVGFGTGKASEVPESIGKASRIAKKSLIEVKLRDQRTIPHKVIGNFGASKIVLKPAGPGTGVIAGGPARAVLECIGVKDILTKQIGSRNPHNVVKATLNGLEQLEVKFHLEFNEEKKEGEKKKIASGSKTENRNSALSKQETPGKSVKKDESDKAEIKERAKDA